MTSCLSLSATVMSTMPLDAGARPAATSDFHSAGAKRAIDAHHLAGALHLGPEIRVDVEQLRHREHGRLERDEVTAPARDRPRARTPRPRACDPSEIATARRTSGTPVTLVRNGTVRLERGFTSSTHTRPSSTMNWMLRSPLTGSAAAICRVSSTIAIALLREKVLRGIDGVAVAGVHARALDVLHDPRDERVGAVAHRVDLDLFARADICRRARDRCRPRAPSGSSARGRRRCTRSPSRDHRGRMTDERERDSRSRSAMMRASTNDSAVPPGGCGMPSASANSWKRRRSSARPIASADRAGDHAADVFDPLGEVERGLPAELREHADARRQVRRPRSRSRRRSTLRRAARSTGVTIRRSRSTPSRDCCSP